MNQYQNHLDGSQISTRCLPDIASLNAHTIVGSPALEQAGESEAVSEGSPEASTSQQSAQQTGSALADSVLRDFDSQQTASDAQSLVSAQQLRDKYNRLFEMAESAPEGPLSDSPHEHGIIDSFLSAHEQNQSSQQGPSNAQEGPSHPQSAVDASARSFSQAAAGVTNPRPDHLSLTEMLLLEEDSLAESKATPLLQHRVSMASNLTDAFPLSPSSSASPLHSDRSMLGAPDHPRPADSASGQQAESSGAGFGGWPGPAPEWISVVMRGKHGGSREAFMQYHVHEGLVYANNINLTLKASLSLPALGALCRVYPFSCQSSSSQVGTIRSREAIQAQGLCIALAGTIASAHHLCKARKSCVMQLPNFCTRRCRSASCS